MAGMRTLSARQGAWAWHLVALRTLSARQGAWVLGRVKVGGDTPGIPPFDAEPPRVVGYPSLPKRKHSTED